MNEDIKWQRPIISEYLPITDYWQSFTAAEEFGPEPIKREYAKILQAESPYYEKITELALVMVDKRDYWHGKDETLYALYGNIFSLIYDYVVTYYKDAQLIYFELLVFTPINK